MPLVCLKINGHQLRNIFKSLNCTFLSIYKNKNQKSKLERLPEYLRDTVDWFIGKARRKEKEGTETTSNDSKLYLEATVLERKLPEMDMRLLVDLPAGLDYNEWLASHTMALFDHVNLVYGSVSEFCTSSSCPDMTGPGQRTYLWFDEKGKKTKVAAPQYIDYVMTFIQKTISDETIFPTKYANEFPSSFESIVRKIVRLLFHVMAHLYAAHFKEVVMLGLHAHLNLTFAHLTALHYRFSLIELKETEILRDLEVALKLTEDNTPESVNNSDKSESSDVESKITLTEGSCELNEIMEGQLRLDQSKNIQLSMD